MKRSVIIAAMLIAFSYSSFSQTSADKGEGMSKTFISAMETNLKIFDTAASPATLIMLANSFERIGKAEQKQWQPFYYAALCYGSIAANTPDKSQVDPLAEKAESYLDLADAIDKNNSEVSCLRGMVLYTRLLVDPVSRWQTMSRQATEYLSKAKEQNPANPRPYLIEARAKLYTPENMGGGPKAAKPIMEECLNKYKEFIPENPIAPGWGKGQAEKLAKTINL
jgi:hypothetical protein